MSKWSRRGSREITPGATSLEGKYRIRSNEYPRDIELSREDNKSCETHTHDEGTYIKETIFAMCTLRENLKHAPRYVRQFLYFDT